MQRKVIYGPPGTGKTTYLMNLLEQELNIVQPENIAFVSFTRQGTYEGVERAVKKFRLTKDQTRYFKTIHSLCFHDLGLSKSMMISRNHYKLLSEQTGINFTGYYTEDLSSSNDAYLHTLSMQRHNPKFGDSLAKELNAKTLAYVKFQYAALKKQLGIMDFDDMLLQYIEHGRPLDIAAAFIDEGQDLTPLQWKVVYKLFNNAQRVYVAGDDDQAVYEWSGANVYEFMNFSDNNVILNKSYRLPKNVLDIVKKITMDIKHRKEKVFTAKDFTGILNSVRSLGQVDFKGGELVLARTNWILRELSLDFAVQGIPYTIKGKPSLDKLTVNAIKAHMSYEDGQTTKAGLIKYKSFFSSLEKVPWQAVLDQPKSIIMHYDSVILNHNLGATPVKFETFHSCKGSENDHVILTPELSMRVHKNMFKRYDSEMRCLYVGMTRTKKDLTILIPKGNRFYPNKYFQ